MKKKTRAKSIGNNKRSYIPLIVGIVLIIAGLVYIAITKFSADSTDTGWTLTNKKTTFTVKVVNKSGKAVSGVDVAYAEPDPSTDNNLRATGSKKKTDSNGTASWDFNICSKGSQKKVCKEYNPAGGTPGYTAFSKITPVVYSNGDTMYSTRYFSASTIKNATITINLDSKNFKIDKQGTIIGEKLVTRVRVVDSKNNPVQSAVVDLYYIDKNNVVKDAEESGTTDSQGYLIDPMELGLQKDNSGKISALYKTYSCTGIGASVGGGKIFFWKASTVATSPTDLANKYEKQAYRNSLLSPAYYTPTIILNSNGKSGTIQYWKNSATNTSSQSKTSTKASNLLNNLKSKLSGK